MSYGNVVDGQHALTAIYNDIGHYVLPSSLDAQAARILHGCLEPAVDGRWTIAMVDEVAWSVGWGADTERLQPSDVEHSYSTPAESNVGGSFREIEQHELVSPSMDTAKRRSLSRSTRSRSRAPTVSRGRHHATSTSQVRGPFAQRSASRSPSPRTPSDGQPMDLPRGRTGTRVTVHGESPFGAEFGADDDWPVKTSVHSRQSSRLGALSDFDDCPAGLSGIQKLDFFSATTAVTKRSCSVPSSHPSAEASQWQTRAPCTAGCGCINAVCARTNTKQNT